MPGEAMGIGTWPCYFARVGVQSRRVTLTAGEPFPLQHKAYIRGLGPAFGCPEARTLPFSKLPYVRVVDVKTEAMARDIRERRLDLTAAEALMAGTAQPHAQLEATTQPKRKPGRPKGSRNRKKAVA